MKICIYGAGYVGLVTGVCLADLGHHVKIIESNSNKLKILRSGKATFYEPDLERLMERNASRLIFEACLHELHNMDALFVCVGTPEDPATGRASMQQIKIVFDELADLCVRTGHLLKKRVPVFIKSTVPVGTNQEITKVLERKSVSGSFLIGSNPEFLREGNAINDFFEPDRLVIGASCDEMFNVASKIYRGLALSEAQFICTDPATAELVKYTANSLLATKLTFMNEIAHLSEKVEANIDQVASAVGADKRIGSAFLKVGPGYGGSCFPKDTKALYEIAQDHNVELSILSSVISANERVRSRLSNLILDRIKRDGRKVAILGVAFKADTDDLREAYSLEIIPLLLSHNCDITIYDPAFIKGSHHSLFPGCKFAQSSSEALQDADIILVLTEWKEFGNVRLVKTEKEPFIFDFRNILNVEEHDPGKFYRIGIKQGNGAVE
ncbi:UDP-glucose/GDP-mannose dehydrogenase family protein [Planktomarina temperata]|nr:UDP-glucose/GDP-mannose dehydrogenase family protein [Planktomarina temperata]